MLYDYEFLKQEHYIYNDSPKFFENGFPNVDDFVTIQDVEKCLNASDHFYPTQIIDGVTGLQYYDKPKHEVFNDINNGHTFYLRNYSLYSDYTNELVRHVEEIFNCRSDIHVYGGTNYYENNSFGAHTDVSATFIVQVLGKTEWTVYNERTGISHPPKSNEPEEKFTIHTNVVMEKGDVLYIPFRGYHKAVPQGPRLSMSISLWEGTPNVDRRKYRLENLWK